ncbi:BDNF/NT-3 growth factors receptor-like, partial [Saccoglossus kowalevskii]
MLSNRSKLATISLIFINLIVECTSIFNVTVPHSVSYGLVGYDTTLICVYKTDRDKGYLTWYNWSIEQKILEKVNGFVIVYPPYEERFSLTESKSPICTLQHNTQPVEGYDLVLKCTTQGIPPPTVQWFKDDYLIEESERYTFSEDGTALTISNTQRDDSGLYMCHVTNVVGSSLCFDAIDVWYLPDGSWPNCNISDEPSRGYFQEGDQIVIICEVTGGNPTPLLYWHDCNNNLLEVNCIWNEQQQNPDVTISECTWELESTDNDQVYTCTGKSAASTETYYCDTGQLDVKYAPDSPTCRAEAVNDLFTEGNNISITCVSLDGNPLETLQWVNTSSGMVMTGTTPEPDDIPSMDILLSEPNNPSHRGEYIALMCTSSSSNPPSTIEWYRNNTLVMDSDYETVGATDYIVGEFNGTITQQDLEIYLTAKHNSAIYQCASFLFVNYETIRSYFIMLEVYYMCDTRENDYMDLATRSRKEDSSYEELNICNPGHTIHVRTTNREIPFSSIYFKEHISSGPIAHVIAAEIIHNNRQFTGTLVKILRDPILLVLENSPFGSLQEYLRECKTQRLSNMSSLSHQFEVIAEFIRFGTQIANGLIFLEENECVIRTLAAKNIQVGNNAVCKISDLGFSTAVMTSDEFEVYTSGRLPLRWMALESLLDCFYTTKSDTWSYGIVLWEIFNY